MKHPKTLHYKQWRNLAFQATTRNEQEKAIKLYDKAIAECPNERKRAELVLRRNIIINNQGSEPK